MSKRIFTFVFAIGAILGAGVPRAVGQDGAKLIGNWKTKTKFIGYDQHLTIAKDGAQWSIKGTFQKDGAVVGNFAGEDIKFANEQLSYRTRHIKKPVEAWGNDLPTLRMDGETMIMTFPLKEGGNIVRTFERTPETPKAETPKVAVAKEPEPDHPLAGKWKLVGKQLIDETWTITLTGKLWTVAAVFARGDKEIGSCHGTNVTLTGNTLTFSRVFDKRPTSEYKDGVAYTFAVKGERGEFTIRTGKATSKITLERADKVAVAAEPKKKSAPPKTKADLVPAEDRYIGLWSGTYPETSHQLILNITNAKDELTVECFVLAKDNKRLAYFKLLGAKIEGETKSMMLSPTWIEKAAPIAADTAFTLTAQSPALRVEIVDSKQSVDLARAHPKLYASLKAPADLKGKELAKLDEMKNKPGGKTPKSDDGSLNAGSLIMGMGFIRQGKGALLCMGGGELQYWDLEKREKEKVIKGNLATGAAAVSPDGKQLARSIANISGKGEGIVQLIDTETGEIGRELTGHETGIASVAYSPDNRWLASSAPKSVIYDRPGAIKIWDAATGELANSITVSGGPVVFSPDSQILAAGHYKEGNASASVISVNFYDLKGKSLGAIILPHKLRINRCAFSPDGKMIATVSEDGMLVVSNVATKKLVKSEQLASVTLKMSQRLRSVVYSADGKLLIVGQEDGILFFRNPSTLAEVKTERLQRMPAVFLLFSPASDKLTIGITSPTNGKILERDLPTAP